MKADTMFTKPIPLQPFDEFNQELERNVGPTDWRNPNPDRPYQLIVIGAGTAGLVASSIAAGLGARVALIERELMGGDCLNVGCVPSKAIIAAARVARSLRTAGEFGLDFRPNRNIDFAKVMQRMRRLRAEISPVDSAARFRDKGIDVFFGSARFAGDREITVERADQTRRLKFSKAIIATGGRAQAPAIEGLGTVSYLTNESLFSLTELPKRLGIIGGGPIGAEMAQSFANLGSSVTLLERSQCILSREDYDAAAIVQQSLLDDGVRVVNQSTQLQLAPGSVPDSARLQGRSASSPFEYEVDQLLVAAGRIPNTDGLDLESAGVDYDANGVVVDDFLQTTNSRIYAAGDICSPMKFTHAADFMARSAVQNALFRLGPFGRKRLSRLVIPWTTYTAPELARVGLNESQANQQGIAFDSYVQPFAEVDRAILDGYHQGFAKILTRKGSDTILGATIVGNFAGDLISQITQAMTNRIGLSAIGSTIHPYPTRADAIRKLGDQYSRTRLTPLASRLLKGLLKLNS